MQCKLAVIGTVAVTPDQVPEVLEHHIDMGRTWLRRRTRPVAPGTRVAAKVAGVSEVWLTGTIVTGHAYRDLEGSPDPARWPWAIDIDWDPPAARGIDAGELFGGTGKYARGLLVGLDPVEFAVAERRLAAA